MSGFSVVQLKYITLSLLAGVTAVLITEDGGREMWTKFVTGSEVLKIFQPSELPGSHIRSNLSSLNLLASTVWLCICINPRWERFMDLE